MEEDLPGPAPLSASVIGSFAYFTVKDRLPVILTCVIDYLCREKLSVVNQYGEEAADEIKTVIAVLSQLKNEMQTNKTLKPFTELLPLPEHDDTALWNACLTSYQNKHNEAPRWFTAPWLLVECYLYKRIHHTFLCTWATYNLPCDLLSVWGNQYDLSLSGGTAVAVAGVSNDCQEASPAAGISTVSSDGKSILRLIARSYGEDCYDVGSNDVSSRSRHDDACPRDKTIADSSAVADSKADRASVYSDVNAIGDRAADNVTNADHCRILDWLTSVRQDFLVNDSAEVCQLLRAKSAADSTLALVLDNAGYELLTDVCLTLVLTQARLVRHVDVYVKTRPWFVSDTTAADISHTLRWLRMSVSAPPSWLSATCRRVALSACHVILLYRNRSPPLTRVSLQGDLNYRKLVGDLSWPSTTPFREVLGPELAQLGPVLALRTVKGGPAVGASEEQLQRVRGRLGDQWANEGKCGMIQLNVA
ncbi:LOW QUALITY PROTEIN: damage-control phosphatase ARMT1 [Hyalella azteca]|uniref:Sugar phosphate phosphatase n=1 Tax=Hyalella azteca TaxID=294128 RepID=A0A979FR93_HYAAZ|nr:LOW QUALITY PROTEIN: damage-control phosphatase ARMT1 [Hyalella azteca]